MDYSGIANALSARPKCSDWGRKVQIHCRTFWAALETEDVGHHALDAFVQLLEQEDSFSIARLVIPEFRRDSSEGALTNPAKQHALTRIFEKYKNTVNQPKASQASFDDELYQAEKDIFLDAEAYRARLLLHRNGALGTATLEEIKEWLDRRPGQEGI